MLNTESKNKKIVLNCVFSSQCNLNNLHNNSHSKAYDFFKLVSLSFTNHGVTNVGTVNINFTTWTV